MTEQIALRFPDGTKDRIKAASLPGETMTNVVLRALTMIEVGTLAAPAAPAPAVEGRLSELSAAVAALTMRVETLEGRSGPVVHVDHAEDDNSTQGASERPSAQTRAAELRASGLSLREIAAALDADGFPTRSGRGQWQPGSVRAILG